MKMKQLTLATAVCATALLLAACGGDGDDEPVAAVDPTEVPASASSSVAKWFEFAKALTSSETSEALSLAKISTLPVSDTDEPLAVGP